MSGDPHWRSGGRGSPGGARLLTHPLSIYLCSGLGGFCIWLRPRNLVLGSPLRPSQPNSLPQVPSKSPNEQNQAFQTFESFPRPLGSGIYIQAPCSVPAPHPTPPGLQKRDEPPEWVNPSLSKGAGQCAHPTDAERY